MADPENPLTIPGGAFGAAVTDDPTVNQQTHKLHQTGSGAVDSVNGQTGDVVLGATDVGADPAGAAAAAQAASQPLDSDLSAIAALGTTPFGRGFLALVAASNARTYMGLGTAATHDTADFDAAGLAAAAFTAAVAASQPVDADLTAIAALGTTAFGRGLLTLADAAALRSTAGLGTAALLSDPITTPHGGTGLATLTNHALVVGAGTNVPSFVGPDSSTSKALFATGVGSDPAFRLIAVGDVAGAAPLASPTFTGVPLTPDVAFPTPGSPPHFEIVNVNYVNAFGNTKLDKDLPDGQIWIGDASDVPTTSDVTGDVAMDNAGIVSITALNASDSHTLTTAWGALNANTAKQSPFDFAVLCAIEVTGTPTTCKVGVGPSNPPTTDTVPVLATLVFTSVIVPAGWWILVTTTGGTPQPICLISGL